MSLLQTAPVTIEATLARAWKDSDEVHRPEAVHHAMQFLPAFTQWLLKHPSIAKSQLSEENIRDIAAFLERDGWSYRGAIASLDATLWTQCFQRALEQNVYPGSTGFPSPGHIFCLTAAARALSSSK